MEERIDSIGIEGVICRTYEEYVNEVTSKGVTYIMSEAEWLDRDNPKLKSSIAGALAAPAFTIASDLFLRHTPTFVDAFTNGGPRAAGEAFINAIKSEGISAANNFFHKSTRTPTINFSGSGKSGGGSTSGGGGSTILAGGGTTGNSNNMLGIYETSPMSLDFRPGLKNRTWINPVNYPDSRTSYCHLTACYLQIPGDSTVKYFFDNVLIPWLQNSAQLAVNFRIDLTLLTSAKIITYLNNLITAYNLYYFTSSIISYTNIPNNKDRGMFALRSMISANDIDYLMQLRALLTTMPVPPALNSFLFWYNQIYTDSSAGNVIIKFMPLSFSSVNNTNQTVTGFLGTDSSVIKNAIANLNTTDSINISSMLTRIVPNWINPTIYDASPTPLYSETFSTMWANAEHRYFSNTSNVVGPIVTDGDQASFYASASPDMDGVCLAMQTWLLSSTYDQLPALSVMAPTTFTISGASVYTNRFSYYYSSTNDIYAWRASSLAVETAFCRPETVRGYIDTGYMMLPTGFYRLKGVTANVARDSAKDFIAYLLSFDSIAKKTTRGKSWSDKNRGNVPDKDKDKGK